jgi:hypothetical protein
MRFANEDDRRSYRKAMRTLALVYGTLMVLAIATATWRVEQRTREAAAKSSDSFGASAVMDQLATGSVR